MSCENKSFTVTYDEDVKGWTSFHSFSPDCTTGMNNHFYTFKNGNLYVHHSDDVPRVNYYGVQHNAKISSIFNESPSEIKAVKAISIEGNKPWNVSLKGYINDVDNAITSTIRSEEFVQKEGIQYAYARRNENTEQVDSKSAYGIGSVQSVTGDTLYINGFSDVMNDGDYIYRGSDFKKIGKIISFEKISNSETKVILDNTYDLSPLDFIIGVKNSRTEGGMVRGYAIRVDLEIDTSDKTEIFAINAEIFKSYS